MSSTVPSAALRGALSGSIINFLKQFLLLLPTTIINLSGISCKAIKAREMINMHRADRRSQTDSIGGWHRQRSTERAKKRTDKEHGQCVHCAMNSLCNESTSNESTSNESTSNKSNEFRQAVQWTPKAALRNLIVHEHTHIIDDHIHRQQVCTANCKRSMISAKRVELEELNAISTATS